MIRRRLTNLLGALAAISMFGAAALAEKDMTQKPVEPAPAGIETAIFASGCFWCTESDFDKVDGVTETISGYTGGATKNPTYELVGAGGTGHIEALLVRFDPKKVSYKKLLDHYWRNVDLLDGAGQFCDRGEAYRPAIFTLNDAQSAEAKSSKDALTKSGRFDKPIAVEIAPATQFTAAEEYHQDYHRKNPIRYKFYRNGCGRDARLQQLWGDEATQ
jgi:methionine-S-sulfoxide reductase